MQDKKNKILQILMVILVCYSMAAVSTSIYGSPFTAKKKSIAPPPVTSSGGRFTKIQFTFREKIAEVLKKIKTEKAGKFTALLLLFAFLYGLFHALGPGHRKSVIFSLFLSRKSNILDPLLLGLGGAGLHALSSIVLVLILSVITRRVATLSQTDNGYAIMEGLTFAILILMALGLLIKLIVEVITHSGHHHNNLDKNAKNIYPMIIISNLVPCPGATMLLLFALYAGLPLYGFLGVIAMSIGMALIMAASGYAAFFGREGLLRSFKKSEKLTGIIAHSIEGFSYILIILFAAYMSIPFWRSILKI